MNIPRVVCLLLLGVSFGVAGCGHLEVAPLGNPNRVITGTVQPGNALPAGAEVVVRVIATPSVEPRRLGGELPVSPGTTSAQSVEQVLGTHAQVLANGTTEPVPFRIEFYAEDTVMQRGVNLDARVSSEGRIRFRTINAHLVTMNSSAYPQQVAVQRVDR